MELEERVLDFRTTKRASFDGKSYVIRLPAEIVRFLKERGISVEDMILEGIWKLKERVFGVLLIFGDDGKSTEQEEGPKVNDETSYDENKEPNDEDDFVVLSG